MGDGPVGPPSQSAAVQDRLQRRQVAGHGDDALDVVGLADTTTAHRRRSTWWRRNSPRSAVFTGTLTARSLLIASQTATASALLSSMVTTVCAAATPGRPATWANRLVSRSSSP